MVTILGLSIAETTDNNTQIKDAKWFWENEEDPAYAADTGFFADFRPNDANRTCSSDKHATPFDKQVRGANLGGWLVLEPWITPSIFYQFLGTQHRYGEKAPEKTAMDMHSFCTALDKEEANRQLRIHYATWVSEDDIKEMAEAGVNSLRVPVGDWMFKPYEPYVGCTDGALEELDRVADLADKYNIDLLLDIHGLVGSQNGFDNSGKTSTIKWTSTMNTQPIGTTMFEHWPVRSAEWIGSFDAETGSYTSINYEHLMHSLDTVVAIVHRYASHPAVVGIEPANEPWELTPIDLLKEYYWRAYKRVKARAPRWKFVIHDSFRFGVQYWSQFMVGCPDIALDTHIYQAWMAPGTKSDYYANACQQKYTIANMESSVMPVIVGEWSLGTDNCAMWLNGFNDNLPGFPNTQCRMVDCPVYSTYLGKDFPGTPLDTTKPIQGPYGTGQSGPAFGKCPVTSDTAFGQKDDIEFSRNLNLKKLNAFTLGHGWYFWNFKTEFGSRWNFLDLVRQGVFPKNVSSYHESDEVFSACEKEDRGDFLCTAKRGVHADDLERGLDYACGSEHVDCSKIGTKFLTLEERADWAFNEFWHAHRHSGATCDFGGAAHLLSTNPDAVSSTLDQRQQQRLHLARSSSSSSKLAVWCFVGIAVGIIVLVATGVRIVSRHARRKEYSSLMTVQV
ncbi:unnamed protein product [Peronospora belbahrii]|uniref:X8 domain-containing protein n=1 Tax=Peronospora belbahrii TaxID=622444 RepID=A0ABN8DAY6_9STRA|nr:unnamed protein product [Peronospora belbahrii]